MEQKHINTDLFAQLTLHEMLLKQLASALLSQQKDNGEMFIAQFMALLRHKLTVPPGSDASGEVDPLQLQEVALFRAQRFFDSVRTGLPR